MRVTLKYTLRHGDETYETQVSYNRSDIKSSVGELQNLKTIVMETIKREEKDRK